MAFHFLMIYFYLLKSHLVTKKKIILTKRYLRIVKETNLIFKIIGKIQNCHFLRC